MTRSNRKVGVIGNEMGEINITNLSKQATQRKVKDGPEEARNPSSLNLTVDNQLDQLSLNLALASKNALKGR